MSNFEKRLIDESNNGYFDREAVEIIEETHTMADWPKYRAFNFIPVEEFNAKRKHQNGNR